MGVVWVFWDFPYPSFGGHLRRIVQGLTKCFPHPGLVRYRTKPLKRATITKMKAMKDKRLACASKPDKWATRGDWVDEGATRVDGVDDMIMWDRLRGGTCTGEPKSEELYVQLYLTLKVMSPR